MEFSPLLIALQDYPNFEYYTTIHKFGRNADVDGSEDVIAKGGAVLYGSPTVSLEVVSAEGADGQTGWIEGLDGSYNWIREYFTLNGTTPVVLETAWYTISRARLTSGTPAGVITFEIEGGEGATWMIMAAGYRGTLVTAFSVPTGYTGFIVHWDVQVVRPSAAAASLVSELVTKPSGQAGWTQEDTAELYTDTGRMHQAFTCPTTLTGPVDIKSHVISVSTSNLIVSSSFDLVLRRDDRGSPTPTEINKP